MAYYCPKDLDGFAPLLTKSDTLFRQQLGQDLLNFLAEPSNLITCKDIGQFIDSLVPWTQSSNYKVASLGIEVLTFLIDRLGQDFRPYLPTVLPAIIDRLGDSKDAVREKSQLLILKLLERSVLSPQALFEKLSPGFSHKNAKIREEVLRCLVNILNEHGAHSITLSKSIPDIVKLLSDPTATVRDTAFNTLVDLYKHVGEKLRVHIQKRNLVPPSKWPALAARFDEAKNRGELLPTAAKTIDVYVDEVDKVHQASATIKRTLSNADAMPKAKSSSANPNAAGAVDEDTFMASFEDVPKVQIFSHKDVTDQLKAIQDIISDQSNDWNKRVEALRKLRSVVIAQGINYDEFFVGLKNLEFALQSAIKDLRSQVVREVCVTIAYLSQQLGKKFDKTAEKLLQPLISLIQNSAKIMASCGELAVRYIFRHIHSPRLIPIVTSNATSSKSKEIRRACCEFVNIILALWPTYTLERQLAALQECVKKGVADADPEARVSSRKAFREFKKHFPEQAESLLLSLEPSYRRALQGDNNIPNTRERGAYSASDNARSKARRSNSAIDFQAAQRAKARAQYSSMTRSKIQCGTASLPRPKRPPETVATTSLERIGRTRSRNVQSQPTSRSGSPSSRLAYLYHRSTEHDSHRPHLISSRIPRSVQGSRDNSRETSPSRGYVSRFKSSSDRPPLSPASRPILAQKILQQSREAENALVDAFIDDGHYRSPRKNMRSLDNHSDDSETSSICSERSYETLKTLRDSYSWSGSQQRLASRDLWEPCRDITEIIALCASTTWQERRDGLMSLPYYLSQETKLTEGELKQLTEIFTKMFTDSHTKGMGVFLDTLHEVIKDHKDHLEYWVYVLLQRVFLKIGSETLNSIVNKLINTLELVKNCFRVDLLIANVYRFLLDATQTPNAKSKVVVLNFLTSLCGHPDAAPAVANSPNAPQVLKKIIAFSQDAKSMEIRHAAKMCFVALWNADTPAVTMLLAELPKEQQDIASNIVQHHMRKTSTSSDPGSSTMVSMSPKPLSPGTPPPFGDQEEVYKSLRRTTAEIQNYSFETLGPKLDRDRETTSQDSGISQMSAGNDVKSDVALVEEKMEDLTMRHFNVRSGASSLPFTNVNGVTETDSNGCRSLGDFKDSDTLIREVTEKCCVDHVTPTDEKERLLWEVLKLIRQGHIQSVMDNSKKVLRLLIDHLGADDTDIKVAALKILTAIFQNPKMKSTWENFVELIALKVLAAHSDEAREVVRAAEGTASAMSVCSIDTIINILAPIIRTSQYPQNLGAIKMLTKLVEGNPRQITDEHLKQVMLGVLKGTDHNESLVRKGSIFCMVTLYRAVGEARFAGYIELLTSSKEKLLRLYISRAEQGVPPSHCA